MTSLETKKRLIQSLKPRPNNPRTHSERQIGQIIQSIEHFGFTNPILIDKECGIIAGHGRYEAAKRMGYKEVPTILLSDMSHEDVRAYVIADNKLAENAGWDKDLLASEFQYLSELEDEFDLSLTGFELPEIDIIIDSATPLDDGMPDQFDRIPTLQNQPVVSRPGDLWEIGDHRLICGDATIEETYAHLMDGHQAHMVFCDPPYNVPIIGNVGGLGKIQHREFQMASGEMSPEEFTVFLRQSFQLLSNYSKPGSLHFHCMDWRHMQEIQSAGAEIYGKLKNLCVWVKNNGGMGSLYRSQHELVFLFKSGTAKHTNNVELGRFGRNRTNVWEYAGVNSFGEGRGDLELHPTVKPVQMVADAVMDCSNRGEIILDAFAGSGTTLIAAEQTKRRGFAIEIDPAYVDIIVQRMQSLFGLRARHDPTGRSFDEIRNERLGEKQVAPDTELAEV